MKENMFYGASNLIFENAKKLRNNVTTAEMILWGRLKEYFPAHKFRRQHPISIYIADLYCHSLKFVIEVDGNIHNNAEVKLNDELRQKNMEDLGLTVVRFTNEEIKNEVEKVLKSIEEKINSLQKKFPL